MNWWLKEHFSDHFVKKAKKEGYRARAVYKLSEIDKKYRFIKSGQIIVDLGAAPGSWSEYVVNHYSEVKVFAVDLLPIKKIPGVIFLQGDFNSEMIQNKLLENIANCKVDVVLSDMAPNLSGITERDQACSIQLAYQALNFAKKTLKKGGIFLIKIFQGTESVSFEKELHLSFQQVFWVKPEASRKRSKEIFLLARDFNR